MYTRMKAICTNPINLNPSESQFGVFDLYVGKKLQARDAFKDCEAREARMVTLINDDDEKLLVDILKDLRQRGVIIGESRVHTPLLFLSWIHP